MDLMKTTKLTAAINKLPPEKTLLGGMGIFKSKGIKTTSVDIRSIGRKLELVENRPRSADPSPSVPRDKKIITLKATHLPVTDTLSADDVQNIEAFGDGDGESKLQQQASVINDTLQDMKDSLVLTQEYLRVGAVTGKLLDKDGSVIANLFTAFGKTQPKYTLGADGGLVEGRKITKKVKADLDGIFVHGVVSLCSGTFFEGLLADEKNYAIYMEQAKKRDELGQLVNEVTIGGVRYIEYDVSVGGQDFITQGKAQAFPIAPIFIEVFAPANYNEAVNTKGKAFYATAERRRMGKGWDIEAQSNPLPFCTHPGALVELSLP